MKLPQYLTLGFVLVGFIVQAQTKKLSAETNHSTIAFRIPIAGFTKVLGKFSDFEINIDWNQNHMDSTQIDATIQVESIDTGIDARDEHLRNADFFDVERFPTIIFQSDSIKQLDYSHFEVYGDLSMHGVTLPYTLAFQLVKLDQNTLGFRAESSLNRIDYGIGKDFIHSSIPQFLAENVELEFYLWTKKRKEP